MYCFEDHLRWITLLTSFVIVFRLTRKKIPIEIKSSALSVFKKLLSLLKNFKFSSVTS